jgi:hypothetical protein
MGVLRPAPRPGPRRRTRGGKRGLGGRRILNVPFPDCAPPPPQPMCWSGEVGRDLTIPVWDRHGRLKGYCKRGGGWDGDSTFVFGLSSFPARSCGLSLRPCTRASVLTRARRRVGMLFSRIASAIRGH